MNEQTEFLVLRFAERNSGCLGSAQQDKQNEYLFQNPIHFLSNIHCIIEEKHYIIT